MNKSALSQAPHIIQQLSTITRAFVNAKILMIDGYYDEIRADARNFFDIIITDNLDMLNITNADFYIDARDTPYTNNVMDLSIFKKSDVIFVLNDYFIEVLRKAKIKLTACVVGSFSSDPFFDFINIANNASIKYRASIDMSHILQFMSAQSKYGVNTNLKYYNRKKLINTFWG